MAEDQQERQRATAIKRCESSDNKYRTSPVLKAFSLTQRQISEHETRADWYSQQWKRWQDGWWHDQRWNQTPVVGSWWDDAKLSWNSWQDLDRWTPSGYPSRKWDISEPPTFPGFSANCLMWRKAVLRWKMTTDHPVEKLGTSTEAFPQPDAVQSILKVLDAKAGWIQEDKSKLLLRKALFSVERGKDESLRQYTTRTMLKEGARLTKQSEQNPQHTFEWQHGARRCCESTQHVGRGKSGRHHQGSCETCGALLHGNWKIQ